jgi:hypothetical protein
MRSDFVLRGYNDCILGFEWLGFWNIKYRNCQLRLLPVYIFSYFLYFSIFFYIFYIFYIFSYFFVFFSYFFIFFRIFPYFLYFFIFFIFFHIFSYFSYFFIFFHIFSLKIRGCTDIFSSWLPLGNKYRLQWLHHV